MQCKLIPQVTKTWAVPYKGGQLFKWVKIMYLCKDLVEKSGEGICSYYCKFMVYVHFTGQGSPFKICIQVSVSSSCLSCTSTITYQLNQLPPPTQLYLSHSSLMQSEEKRTWYTVLGHVNLSLVTCPLLCYIHQIYTHFKLTCRKAILQGYAPYEVHLSDLKIGIK